MLDRLRFIADLHGSGRMRLCRATILELEAQVVSPKEAHRVGRQVVTNQLTEYGVVRSFSHTQNTMLGTRACRFSAQAG